MIKYIKSNEIRSNNYEYITFDKVEYKTKIRKIRNSLLITVPKKVVDEFKLEKGHPLFIIIEQKDKIIKFITCLSHGSYVFSANIPNHNTYGLLEEGEINLKVLFNQRFKNVVKYNNILDITGLDLFKINYFIDGNKVHLHYKSPSTKKGNVVNRFLPINEELAYTIGLYDAEGAKNSFRFTNSDPKLIKIFLKHVESIFKLKEQDFDAQITMVSTNKESNKAKNFWSKEFPNLNIFKTVSYKYGEGTEFGSLSVLINTLTMSTIWKSLRDKMGKLIVLNEVLSSSYISGILDGDGNVYIDKDTKSVISVRITSDSRKDCSLIIDSLKKLDITFKIKDAKNSNKRDIIIFKWGNFVKLFNYDGHFRYNIKRKTKFLEGLLNHRRSKVILRTLKAIADKNYNPIAICSAMKIQKKHIRRVYNYLEQLKILSMINYDNQNTYLTEKGKKFLNTKYNI